jgi:hypothetical protein
LEVAALQRLQVLYRCPVCGRPGHGNLLGGAVHCTHCGAAFVSFTRGEGAFVVLGNLNSGEAVLKARRIVKDSGYRGRLRIESEERLLVPWRLTVTERLNGDGEPRREETANLRVVHDLERLLLPELDPLTLRLEGGGAAGLTLEPLEEERLSTGDLLLAAEPPQQPGAQTPESLDPSIVSLRSVLLYYPFWRIVFTAGDDGPDWPLVLDGLAGHLVAGDPPRGQRTIPAFWVGVPALGAYALGCLVNLFTGGLSGFEWLSLVGALAGVGGLFYLKGRRAEQNLRRD